MTPSRFRPPPRTIGPMPHGTCSKCDPTRAAANEQAMICDERFHGLSPLPRLQSSSPARLRRPSARCPRNRLAALFRNLADLRAEVCLGALQARRKVLLMLSAVFSTLPPHHTHPKKHEHQTSWMRAGLLLRRSTPHQARSTRGLTTGESAQQCRHV